MNLDRRVQFRRASLSDDGFNSSVAWDEALPETDNHGLLVWASKTDVSDVERWKAGEVAASITARFVVRYSAFAADITPIDRLVCEGVTYGISGIKEVGRRRFLEITASARADK